MGREAVCICRWAGAEFEVKALLESAEVILRGGLQRRVPFAEIQSAVAVRDALSLHVGGETLELMLGQALAQKWVAAIRNPPTLARKLGITRATVVRVIGPIRDEALQAALAEAGRVSATGCSLIIAVVDTRESLDAALLQASSQIFLGVPIWLVYSKGSGLPLGETLIRTTLRGAGLMDTKIAFVSAKLTALRFNLPRT